MLNLSLCKIESDKCICRFRVKMSLQDSVFFGQDAGNYRISAHQSYLTKGVCFLGLFFGKKYSRRFANIHILNFCHFSKGSVCLCLVVVSCCKSMPIIM